MRGTDLASESSMSRDTTIETFERDGYVLIEDFFADALMNHLDQLIRRYFGDSPDFWHDDEFLEKAQTEVIPWFPQNEGIEAFDATGICVQRIAWW